MIDGCVCLVAEREVLKREALLCINLDIAVQMGQVDI
jgi:hypothetical protein